MTTTPYADTAKRKDTWSVFITELSARFASGSPSRLSGCTRAAKYLSSAEHTALHSMRTHNGGSQLLWERRSVVNDAAQREPCVR